MPISGVTDYTLRSNTGTGQKSIDMAAFMTLLTVQLTTQNPLEPMKDTDFFAQLAQLGTVQGMDNLKGGIASLNSSMQMVEASGMIGKIVTAQRANPQTGESPFLTGEVTSVFLENGKFVCKVHEAATNKDVNVPMAAIQSVKKN